MKLRLLYLSLAIFAFTISSCKKKYADLFVTSASQAFQNGGEVDLGSVTKNSIEEDNKVDFVIESSGTKEINITSLELSGANASAFTLDKKSFSTGVLEVDKSQTFGVSLITATSGTYNASIVIKSDAKDNETYTLNLTGIVQ